MALSIVGAGHCLAPLSASAVRIEGDAMRRPTQGSAAAPEPALAYGIARLLAFAKELGIGHDRLLRMVRSPMRDICLVVGNTDHQPRRSGGPVERSARRPRGAVEE